MEHKRPHVQVINMKVKFWWGVKVTVPFSCESKYRNIIKNIIIINNMLKNYAQNYAQIYGHRIFMVSPEDRNRVFTNH